MSVFGMWAKSTRSADITLKDIEERGLVSRLATPTNAAHIEAARSAYAAQPTDKD